MIRPRVLLVADSVIRDSALNTMSVINIHEQFYPSGYPLLIPRFTVFAILEREQADPVALEAQLVIRLEEEVVFERAVEINFGAGLVTRAVLQFQGFVLPRPGILRLTMIAAGQELQSYAIAAFPAGTPAPVFQQPA